MFLGRSSPPSSSDEDRRTAGGGGGRLRRGAARHHHHGGGGVDAYQGAAEDTSTLESVPAMIDRAKSFEYIPGESFHLQENSSSYEYLPGEFCITISSEYILGESPSTCRRTPLAMSIYLVSSV
jgi:hypothetical protein